MKISSIIEKLRKLNVIIKEKNGQLVLSGSKDKISSILLNEIKKNKPALIEYIKSYESQSSANVKNIQNRNEDFSLTAQQKSIWLASQNSNTISLYNQPSLYIASGKLNVDALILSINKIVKKHESLRTGFYEVNGEPRQKVLDGADAIVDYSELKRNENIDDVYKKFASYIFDLSKPPLLKCMIVKENAEKHYLLFNIHHIISDGWSVNIFFKELLENYSSPLKNKNVEDANVGINFSFKECVDFQNSYIESDKGEADLNFWKKRLGYEYSSTKLESKNDLEGLDYYEGEHQNFSIVEETCEGVNLFCKSQKITPFHFYSSIFTLLLKRYTGKSTISFGTPFACRSDIKYKDAIGCIINTLPIVINSEQAVTFDDLLKSVTNEITEVYDHQNYPAEKIVENIKLSNANYGSPLFDIIIVYQNYSLSKINIDRLEISYLETPIEKSKAGLVLRIFEENDKLLINIEYSKKLFDSFFIKKMFRHFETLLKNVLANPYAGIDEIEYLTGREKSSLISLLDNSHVHYPKDKTVLDYLSEQLKKQKDKIAVTVNGKNISYAELDRKSNILANYLIEGHKISANEIVGIATGRNENLIIGILAILKTGAAYLPINPDYPETRKQLMLNDSGCNLILTDDLFDNGPRIYLSINKVLKEGNNHDRELLLKTDVTPADIAYIIYTSGSTGKPKGVAVTHKNLLRLFFNDEQLFDFNENDIWTLFHSYSFDFSVWEIFGALLFGGRLVIVPNEITKEPVAFYNLLAKEKVTVLNQTPSALYRIQPDEHHKLSLRYIVFGGEALQPKKIKEWKLCYPETKIINMYGITETCVHVTYKEIEDEDIKTGVSNIGKPIPTLGVCILDEKFKVLPKGLSGQICVYGEGLSRGYLNQPELTAEKFKNIAPFGLCYLSGDLGRILENGDIEYLGRMDDQVQLHGFRVELSEVENALIKIEEIKEAVVLAIEKYGDISLNAFYTASEEVLKESIRRELSKRIPTFMMPANYILVETIPLTPNGKIDKNALMNLQSAEDKVIIKPSNEIEEKILEAWKTTLSGIEISIDDSFFAIGGDSIKALKLVREINAKVSAGLTIAGLYENDTIKKLAAKFGAETSHNINEEIQKEVIRIENNSNELIKKNDLSKIIEQILPMSDIQRGMIYYSLKNPDSSIYHDQFVYQIYVKDFSFVVLEKSLELMMAKHPMLRTSFNMFDYNEDVQLIHKNVKPAVQFEDLSEQTKNVIEKNINDYAVEERSRGFDISQPPLWRMKVFKTPDDVIVICWSFHHSLFDGWSNASFFTELLSVYKSVTVNINYNIALLQSDYRHYVVEQNIIKRNDEIAAFWKKELGEYKRLQLPKTESQSIEASVEEYFIRFNEYLLTELKKLATELNTDVKTLFFAAYLYCMSLLTYDDDVLVGVVTNNRPLAEESEKMLGCFLNTVPFRFNVKSSGTWKEFLLSVITKINELKKYEGLSLFEIIKLIDVPAGDSNPLFDVVFNYVDFNIYENVYDDYSLEQYGKKEFDLKGYENTNTPLNFTVSNTFDKPVFKISYNPNNISGLWVKRLGSYYCNILTSMANGINVKIEHNKIISEDDKDFFDTINRTEKKYDLNRTYIDEFEKSLALYSDNVAVVYNDKNLTYDELNANSEKLSALIQRTKQDKNEIVALLTEASFNLYTGMLAILKAGCAVLPVSDKTPKGRIFAMLKDSGAGIILASRSSLAAVGINSNELSVLGISVLLFDDIDYINLQLPESVEDKETSPGDAAYIVYTSGTTGRPKGIVFNHSSILNLCNWYNDFYSITKEDCSTKYADINYDANIWEILPAFLRGASIYTIPDELKLDMPRLNEFYKRNGITVSWLPTSILEQFLLENNTSLRVLTTGGDRLKNVIKQSYRIFNNYGPAENTVCATVYELDFNEDIIPIGKPISNNKIYILKKDDLQIMPPGIAGEICLAGASLSKGYLNDVFLTSKKFVVTKEGERVYRTGDLGRFNEDGNLEFLGRIDRQVKIRGQRLEVEEIESLLLKHPYVKEAVITTDIPDDSSVKELLAFVVKDDLSITENKIEEYLSKQLPAYMVPSRIIFINKIPLTITGKVDYKILSKSVVKRQSETVVYGNETEQNLARIWAEVLNKEINDIDNKRNFFEQGGNSLSLIRIQRRINQKFGTDISIAALLKNTTLAKLAKHIEEFTRIPSNKILPRPADKLEAQLTKTIDDIAVIGMACKFPGADNMNEFWNNLVKGVEAITFFSDEELVNFGIPKDLIDNGLYTKAAGIINDPESFDADFFNYTDNEARTMDPQIRIFHECVWSALEDGGYDPGNYNGRIGLFAGASKNNHWENIAGNIDGVDGFSSSLLSSRDNLATLISYKLNLRGPAVNVYTACSTSLVALHEACKSIRSVECEMALCGGVNLSLPFIGGSISGEGSVFSEDGHCRPFCAEGKGTIVGKGAGVVLLKPLETAIKDGDNIYAVIKKSAVNNDGYQKVGYTAPSIDGQIELLKNIYIENDIDPGSIDYIEAHGTGTELGDVVEVDALKNVFANCNNKVAIGSVKSNIGHLDTAAGIAAFIKTVLMLDKRTLVQSLHSSTTNKKIDFEKSPFYILNKTIEWKHRERNRRAGISSFGIGGTNAHVVIEEYIKPENPDRENDRLQVIPLSAKTNSALIEYKKTFKRYLEENNSVSFHDLAFTLQTTRKAFQYRSAFVCSNNTDLIKELSDDSSYYKMPGSSNIIFLFPGQGTQYVNMGRELYETQPKFKLWFDKCDEIIKQYIDDVDISKIVYPDTKNVNRKEISETVSAHCSLFVFEYSLAQLLMKWDIKPSAMIGHSLGEYVAACIAGIISLEDALKIIVARGKLVKKVSGRMLSVSMDEDSLISSIAGFNNGTPRVSLSAINSDVHFIVSGDETSIVDFNKHLAAKGIEGKILHIDFASHSGLMKKIISEFNDTLGSIKHNKTSIPIVTNLDNRLIKDNNLLQHSYWSEHLLNPVRFAKGLSTLVLEQSNSVLIEVGPGSTLSTFAKNISSINEKYNAVSLIPHPKEEVDFQHFFYERIAALWSCGVAIDWKTFNGDEQFRKVPLPTYCFDKTVYSIPKSIYVNENSYKNETRSWYYIPQWKQSLISQKEKLENKNILIFTDDLGFTENIITLLSRNELRIVKVGKRFEQIDNKTYLINPVEENDYKELFADLKSNGFMPANIIHLLSLAQNPVSSSYEEIVDGQNKGFISLTYIAKAVAANLLENIQITVAVNNLSDITGTEEFNSKQSPLLAAVKVIPQEYYGIKVHCVEIDLKEVMNKKEYYSEKLVNEISEYSSSNKKEELVVYRNKKRWIQSYENIDLNNQALSASRFKEGGVYIITGGAGNVGNVISLFLSEKYKVKLIITGKTELPAKESWDKVENNLSSYQKKLINNLLECERKGGEVTYFSVDVSDKDLMAKVFDYTINKYECIDGIIHAAAATKDESISIPLSDTSLTKLQNQFNVKVKGMFVISELVGKYKPGFVMVTSSTSSILGGLGFGCYSASNIFVNSFVKEKNRDGITDWISLIWDGWYFPEYAESINEAPRETNIKPEDGKQILESLNCIQEIDNVIISKRNIYKEITKWLGGIYTDENKKQQKNNNVKERPFLITNYKKPENEVQKKLCEIWEEFFGISSVGIQDHFYELGGDSLKATSVVSIIHKRIGIRIPLTEFLKKPTIEGLSFFIEQSKKEEYYEIKSAPAGKTYPLSSAQKRLFLLYRMEKKSLAYNVHSSALLEGKLNLVRLENSFKELIKRHESLRTVFYIEQGEPVQRVLDFGEIEFGIELTDDEDNFFRAFDLEKAPLIRAGVKRIDESTNVLLIDTHHIVSDAISMSICFKEISSLYNGLHLAELPVQYKDFAVWQNKSLSQDFMMRQKEFWKASLSGELPVLNLPYDFQRPSVQKYEGSALTLEIGKEVLVPLRIMAQENESTLFMVLLSAFNVLLSKYTGQDDIIVGMPSAGRKHEELKNVIGMFANTLTLRNKPINSLPFDDFLKNVKDNSLKAFENQDYQFEELVEELKVERDVSRNPIFDVMFVYINIDFAASGMKEIKIKPYELQNKISRFDLTLHCSEEKDKIALTFEYSSHLFRKETIERMSKHFRSIIKSIVDNPRVLLKDISLVDEVEIKLLGSYNNTDKQFTDEPLTVTHLYNKQLKNNKDKTGIVLEDESESGIKYSVFEKNINKLAAKILMSKNNKPGGLVGLVAERNEFMIFAVNAILKSGNGYVPVDPHVPEERAKYIVEDSGCAAILCERKFENFARRIFSGRVIVIEEVLEENIAADKISFPQVTESDPLFLLYTSGSTGQPKGVLMPHKPIINLLLWMREEYPVENERILFLNPYTFDMSIWGLYAWAVNGSSVCVLKHGDEKDPSKIVKAVKEKSITSIHFVPSMLAVFLEYIEKYSVDMKGTKLRYIFVSGEVLNKHLIDKFNKCFEGINAELVNFYGPTETHVVSHFRTKRLEETNHITVPVGKPISNTKVLIVDKEMKGVPQGIVGEILLGGDCLADCYLNKAEMTKEKFIIIENELTKGRERYYRTGDLGRWLSDGNIEFLGRNDFQIKIRGFRVEPGEVQSVINRIDGVKESLVVVKETEPGDKRLVAYVVYEDKETYNEAFIRNELKKQVADYMVPSVIVAIDKFPLNTNGKVERKLLPEPKLLRERKNIVTPRNKLEKRIAEIWSEVLKINNIGINDNFFDLGGHSLLIISVHGELEKEIDKKIEVVDLFRYPTIAALSEFIKDGNGNNAIIDKAMQRAANQKKARELRLINSRRKDITDNGEK